MKAMVFVSSATTKLETIVLHTLLGVRSSLRNLPKLMLQKTCILRIGRLASSLPLQTHITWICPVQSWGDGIGFGKKKEAQELCGKVHSQVFHRLLERP